MPENTPAKVDWRAHIKTWQESGISQNAYCQQQQLRPNQFSYWKLKLLGPSSKKSFNSNLVPVRLAPVLEQCQPIYDELYAYRITT